MKAFVLRYPLVTAVLTINWIVFGLLVVATGDFWGFRGIDLIQYGANFGPKTAYGERWRLFSSMFVHAGLLHIALNSFILIQIGPLLEQLLSRFLFTLGYLTSGIAGSIASLYFNYGVVSVGASGAIFGLFGITLALLLANVFPAELKSRLLKSISVFILLNLAIGLIGPIDNAAHLGGLIWGAAQGGLMAAWFYHPLKSRLAKMISRS